MLGMSVAEWLTHMVSLRCAKLAGQMYPVQQFYLILQNLKTFIIQSFQNCDFTLGPAAAVQQIIVIGDDTGNCCSASSNVPFQCLLLGYLHITATGNCCFGNQTTKLPAHTSCSDVNARGVLDLCSQ